MNSQINKKGFTLVEILVAVAIITAILSMVYGSYYVTTRSMQVCKRRIELSQGARELLEKMAQQIRCCYAGTVNKPTPPAGRNGVQKEETTESIINYFSGNSTEKDGRILYLVTTNNILDKQAPGLFEVIYKFDKNNRKIFVSADNFVDGRKRLNENRNWQMLAENIESITLQFSNGRDWLAAWDFEEKKMLPNAVKINITCQDEKERQYCFGTAAYISNRKNQVINTTSEALVTVNK